MYKYAAIVKKVIDGDTVKLDIDLGFSIWWKNQNIRLLGVDAPEVRGEEREEGLKSKEWLKNKLPVGSVVVIQTKLDKKGKYGRVLGTILSNHGVINDLIIEEGYAKKYE